jgi:cytochrome c-type biogenesis protein CcmH/NrfG
MSAAAPSHITRADLEQKMRELQSEVETVGSTAKSYAVIAGGIAVVAVIGVAYLLGRRKGRRRTTVVEVRRF